MRTIFPSALVASLFVIGCGGGDSTSSGGGGPANDPNTLTFDTGSFEAPAGDSFTCFYLDAKTPRELSVNGSQGLQGPGGHHILIYYTDIERAPTHHPCVDSEMVNWHQIAGSAGHDTQGAEGIIKLPEGLAIKVPEGKQLVIQSHYINTTGKTETVDDSVTIQLVEPKSVKAYANYFVNSDENFEVPPHGTFKHVTECTIPRDLQTVLALGHMHEYGTQFSMQIEDENGANEKMLYDEKWSPVYTSHPPINYFPYDSPLVLEKGQKLVQSCEWSNTTADPLEFPREMCVGFFYYYPDAGELRCSPKALP